MDIWSVCGNNGTINRTTFTANCNSVSERVAAYGQKLISTGFAEWTVRYNITNGQCCREIGIADNTEILNGYINSKAYVWYNSNIYCPGSSKASVENIDQNNDVISIRLDLNKNTVSFYKNNDKDKMVTIDIESGKTWRLAAHIDTKGQSFTIESFVSTSFDTKQIIQLQQEYKEIEQQLSVKSGVNDKLLNEIEKLKIENDRLLNEVKELKIENDESLNEIETLKSNNDKIEDKLISKINENKVVKYWLLCFGLVILGSMAMGYRE